MSYNGWSNRETWLVNLHYGDQLHVYAQELKDDYDGLFDENVLGDYLADFVLGDVDEIVQELPTFLSDMINLDEIDFYELAESILEDLE